MVKDDDEETWKREKGTKGPKDLSIMVSKIVLSISNKESQRHMETKTDSKPQRSPMGPLPASASAHVGASFCPQTAVCTAKPIFLVTLKKPSPFLKERRGRFSFCFCFALFQPVKCALCTSFSWKCKHTLVYRDRQKYASQALWIWGEKIAFSSLLQAEERNFFTSYSRNQWEVINPSPVL